MMFTLTRTEVRRLLKLEKPTDVDRLADDRTLIPAAYDPNARPLFDVRDVRRAAVALTLGRLRIGAGSP